MSEPTSTAVAAVEVRNVTKTYEGGTTALAGIDLRIEQGEFVSLTGPSGCGKSTLLNLIAAMDTPTSGTVRVNGIEVTKLHNLARFRREQVGLVFQLHNLIPQVSVLANLEVAMFSTGRSAKQRRERAEVLIEKMGLAGREKRLPIHLSGGERQRVAIARALVNEPKMILADEPTGSLDSVSSAMVLDTFEELNAQGVAILLVTHDLAVAAVARRQLTMLDGRMVDEETRPSAPSSVSNA
jgi:putative ABC transport system ATP-binding protein